MLLYVCVIYFRRIKSRENRGKVSHVLSVLRRPLNWPNDGVTSQSNATGVKIQTQGLATVTVIKNMHAYTS